MSRTELWIVLALLILVVTEWPKHRDMPIIFKIAHFSFVAIFTLIGFTGVHYLLMMISHHHLFVELFSTNVPPNMKSTLFVIVTVIFSVMGAVLCLGALMLGHFHRWGLGVMITLSLPYGGLYPTIVSALIGGSRMPHADKAVRDLTVILIILSLAAVMMSSSQRFSKHVRYV